ncbi:PspA/IM30 family protein [Sphingobacterium hungaricum]
MNIFKRLLKIGQAEIHALVEKMEDPIALTEQGIRDMKQDLAESTESYAKVRALIIRSENRVVDKTNEADSYEEKAKKILGIAQAGEIDKNKAEQLVIEALQIKKDLLSEIANLKHEISNHKISAEEINNSLSVLKFNIAKWEKELSTLRAKQKVSATNKTANQQMAQIEANSTIQMLERMKAKAEEDQALAKAYNELAEQQINEKIDHSLERDKTIMAELETLKKKIGL